MNLFINYFNFKSTFPYMSGPGRLRGLFMKSSGFPAYHFFMASMGVTWHDPRLAE